MPKKRNPLTLEEHKQLSAHLREVDEIMSKVLKVINGRVPVKILDQLLVNRGIDKALYRFRSDLETLMFKEVGEQQGATIRVYYPNEGPGPRKEADEQHH